jgi:hypothetical protein
VTEAVETFLDRDWSMHTRRNFASDLKRFREAFGKRRVDRLKPDDLRACLEGLTTSRGGPERPVSAQTFNRHFGTLCNLFGWLERLEEIDRNPMDKVERRKLGERLPRPMSRDQVQAFFGRIDELRDKALFSLLYGSGPQVLQLPHLRTTGQWPLHSPQIRTREAPIQGNLGAAAEGHAGAGGPEGKTPLAGGSVHPQAIGGACPNLGRSDSQADGFVKEVHRIADRANMDPNYLE